ncbi:MAG TPA: non-heme iron oxygenase ferredoxin subunit [Kaistia sp.]|nr:non-heme iron oxygenase ferredoxin subunit [Kaistia sp.]
MPIRNGTWTRLFPAEDLAPGMMVGVEVGEHKLAICNVRGTFHATQNVCTHAFAILSDGWLDDDIIECPLHGGRFEVETGRAVREPAEERLIVYPVRVAADGVEVLLPEDEA